jgi:hypothetical protein
MNNQGPESFFGLVGSFFALLLFSLCTQTPAYPQQYPRWELFTGFSYAHINLGPQAATFQPTDQNYYGMHINGSFNPRSYLRIIICDFSVQIGGTSINIKPEHADVRTSQILFGPEFVQHTGKSTLFAHTLIGVTNTRLVASIGGHDIVPDLVNQTSLAFGLGGGVDFHVTRLVTIRAFEADYIPTRISGSWESHFRASTGVVATFGWRGAQ